jgi:multicomponent Na+:H+ antiporter subunit F
MIISALIVLLFSMALTLFRAIAGVTAFDRILAVNSFGTYTVLFIALLSYFNGNNSFLDIALIYALINFISTIAFLRYFKHGHFGDE